MVSGFLNCSVSIGLNRNTFKWCCILSWSKLQPWNSAGQWRKQILGLRTFGYSSWKMETNWDFSLLSYEFNSTERPQIILSVWEPLRQVCYLLTRRVREISLSQFNLPLSKLLHTFSSQQKPSTPHLSSSFLTWWPCFLFHGKISICQPASVIIYPILPPVVKHDG